MEANLPRAVDPAVTESGSRMLLGAKRITLCYVGEGGQAGDGSSTAWRPHWGHLCVPAAVRLCRLAENTTTVSRYSSFHLRSSERWLSGDEGSQRCAKKDHTAQGTENASRC